MLFSHLARVVAYLALAFALFRLFLGFGIASGFIGPYEEALARYTTDSSSGEVIDSAIFTLVFAVALGTLAEISFATRKTQ